MDDLISRRAPIDHWRSIIDATNEDSIYNMGFVDGLEFCINHLSTMPSAQSEVTEEEVKEDCRKRRLSIVDSALLKKYASEGPEPRWIPCSERLPEEGQDILAYRVFGDDERIIPANYGNGCWFDCHMNCSVGHVVAWMPLPKPYEGEQNGDENE